MHPVVFHQRVTNREYLCSLTRFLYPAMNLRPSMRPFLLLLFYAFSTLAVAAGDRSEQLLPEPADDMQSVAEKSETAAPPGFPVWEFRVTGNTLLERSLIERTLYPFLGPDKTIDDLEQARLALQQVYQQKGYATGFVDIPEQQVTEGIVQLAVTEGELQRLKISGSRYFSLGRIRAGVPSLREGSVPNLNQVQEQLAELNRANPDREIVPALRPGATPGTLEVELKVDDELPVHGSLEVNNRYTSNTSETRLSASLRYANLWQKDHTLGLSWQISPERRDEVEVLAANYVWPLAGSDTVLAAYAVDSQSDVASVGALSVIGNGTIVGLRAIKPLAGFDGLYHSLTLGLDYKDFDESVNLLGGDSANTPINYLSFIADYSATLAGDGQVSRFGLSGHFAPRAGINDEQEFASKRFNASASYFYLRLNGEHERRGPWRSRVKLSGSGQVAGKPLISNEQFSIGGAQSVRGYPESFVLGDDGLQGSVEWRSPNFDRWLEKLSGHLHLVLFADGGWVQTRDPLPGQSKSDSLAGIGGGLRFGLGKGFSGDFWWARALQQVDEVDSGDSRLHFSIKYEI
ncbi:MAG TPA: hypothetical protein DCF45_02740 [Gammaproteobacteria bacterium]|nr:hypothetical protein [Gammaproteobacteria bacterium]